MTGIREFQEDAPLFTLVCGCKGYLVWNIEISWEIDVVPCDGHVIIHDLPDDAIRVK